jgi:hypothetical protein
MNDELPGALVILALGLLTSGFYARQLWVMQRVTDSLPQRLGKIAFLVTGVFVGAAVILAGAFYLNLLIFGTDL